MSNDDKSFTADGLRAAVHDYAQSLPVCGNEQWASCDAVAAAVRDALPDVLQVGITGDVDGDLEIDVVVPHTHGTVTETELTDIVAAVHAAAPEAGIVGVAVTTAAAPTTITFAIDHVWFCPRCCAFDEDEPPASGLAPRCGLCGCACRRWGPARDVAALYKPIKNGECVRCGEVCSTGRVLSAGGFISIHMSCDAEEPRHDVDRDGAMPRAQRARARRLWVEAGRLRREGVVDRGEIVRRLARAHGGDPFAVAVDAAMPVDEVVLEDADVRTRAAVARVARDGRWR